MPGETLVEFHSEVLSDFQMRRLVQASLEKFSVPIKAFLSDAAIIDDCCLGISFDHLEQGLRILDRRRSTPSDVEGSTGMERRALLACRYTRRSLRHRQLPEIRR